MAKNAIVYWGVHCLIWGLVCSWSPSSTLLRRRSYFPPQITFIKAQTQEFDEEVNESEESAFSRAFDRKLPSIDVERIIKAQKQNRECLGDLGGIDDPRDADWRLKTESIIRNFIKSAKHVAVYDISWHLVNLNVVIEPREGGAPINEEMIVKIKRSLEDALMPHEDELHIFSRLEMVVSSRGAPNDLKCERDFIAFKGFDVVVALKPTPENPVREPMRGQLVEVGIFETFIMTKGRQVSMIPNTVVASITLANDGRRNEETFDVEGAIESLKTGQ